MSSSSGTFRPRPPAAPRGFEQGASQTLKGSVERITFQNPDSGYVVARFMTAKTEELVTIVGSLGGIAKGEELEIHGVWENDPRYGPQLMVKRYSVHVPTAGAGLRDYLTTFSNIGERRAQALEDEFGEDLADTIEKNPAKLTRVKGISRDMAETLQKEWRDRASERQVMVFCQSFGISPNQARKIFKTYGDRALQILNVDGNPYRLAEDVYGFGFKKADEIAQKLGIAPDDPRRVEAALIYALQRGADDGNTYLRARTLCEQAQQEVAVDDADLEAGLGALSLAGRIIPDPGLDEPGIQASDLTAAELLQANAPIYLPLHHRTEVLIARELAFRLASLSQGLTVPDEVQMLLDKQRARQKLELSEEQEAAIREALVAPVMLLTGGPGTGKSTCLKLAVDVFEAQRKIVSLCAPTGRAAKRLSETTGREAVTIHRLLEFQGAAGGFQRNEEDPIDAEVVIVDEVSMLDSQLAAALLKALPSSSSLVLVGDPDQLPSVGAGNVLADLIATNAVPRAHLTQIFRQAQTSQIVTNAHRINQGLMPEFKSPPGQKRDFLFKFVNEDKEIGPREAAEMVVDQVANGFTSKNFDPIRMVQVLTPMHNGPVGAKALNQALQETLNPVRNKRDVIKAGIREFRLGDRVMQMRNNYDKEVFNGDIGFVRDINTDENTCTVYFDNPVTYQMNELEQLQLAYAITVHKSQGSEFPVVVMPLVTQHFMMLRRNLLYTALTRAKKVAVLVGQKKAVFIAVQRGTDDEDRRCTGLGPRLLQAMDQPAGVKSTPPRTPKPRRKTAEPQADPSDTLYRMLAAPPFDVHRFAKLSGEESNGVIYVSKGARLAIIIDGADDDPRFPPLWQRSFQLMHFPSTMVLSDFSTIREALEAALES